MLWRWFAASALVIVCWSSAAPVVAQDTPPTGGAGAARAGGRNSSQESWRRPFEPFHVIGNIYYVGTEGLSVYLITTPEGHILLDTGLADTIRSSRDHIEKLGFKPQDIKIMLASHAHYDHVGGHPWMKEQTGAKVLAMEGDAATLEAERTPTKVDQVLHDGDQVKLGGVTLTANHTPGHTKGDTTWTMQVEDHGKKYDVVFFGSTTILGNLLGNRNYPNMPDDYTKAYAKLKSLPCDVFLAPHGNFFGLEAKRQKQLADAKANPFIDPDGYRQYVQRAEQAFLAQLARERAAAEKP